MQKQKILTVGGLTVAALLALTLGGCMDDRYTARRDSITRSAGDAIATNQATQTIDPWSPASKDKSTPTSGRKAATAAQRYEQDKVIKPRGLNTTTVTEQATGSQSDTTIQK